MKTIILLLLTIILNAGQLKVTATAYTSHRAQCDSTPFLAAWNNHLSKHDFKRSIAVSVDLLKYHGIHNGAKLRLVINGHTYRVIVKDKMNKRWRKRVDLYFYLDRKAAMRFGVKHGVLYF